LGAAIRVSQAISFSASLAQDLPGETGITIMWRYLDSQEWTWSVIYAAAFF